MAFSNVSPGGRQKLLAGAGAALFVMGVVIAVRPVRVAQTAERVGTFERVRAVLVTRLGVPAERVRLQASLAADLGLDASGRQELRDALGEEFETDVLEAETEPLETVADVVRRLDAGRAAAAEPAPPFTPPRRPSGPPEPAGG